jgi:hypothetical protein
MHAYAKTTVVGTIAELTSAVTVAKSGDTILLQDGTYQVVSYGVVVRSNNVTIQSQSGKRDNVIITGNGMNGSINYGFWVAGDSVTIQGLTIQNVSNHCIQTDVNTDFLHINNCVLKDAREQLLKVVFNSSVNDPSENGIIENCHFSFSSGIASQYYTGGIDCHFAKNFIVRNNVFKNIRSPGGSVAEHAIHFWTRSENTLVENNSIIDCDRGIGFGMGDSPHYGGIIRNNMIYHRNTSGDFADAGITLESCTNAKIYNNTIFFENDYLNAIEYRFTSTNGLYIANNLTNRLIRMRDGASATVTNNVTNAVYAWFKNPVSGDLHLASSGLSDVIHKGVAIDGLTKDIDGDLRVTGTIDIGADQFITSNTIMKKISSVSVVNYTGKSYVNFSAAHVNSSNFVPGNRVYDLKGSLLSGPYHTSGFVIKCNE